jgi:peptidyl-tRNA hydrolase, PTH1 family
VIQQHLRHDLGEFLNRGADVVESLITKGLDLTQSQYNS